jgi:Ni/Fe-hydrogenase 1 B-type cytochrome subunit
MTGQARGAADEPVRTYRVWDAPTRVFHWVNALLILGSLVTGLPFIYVFIEGTPRVTIDRFGLVHVALGYAFVINLFIRVAWGFLGNRFARWPAIVPDRSALVAVPHDIADVVRGHAHAYLGRSPLSRISNTAMFLLFFVQGGTGLARVWLYHDVIARIHMYSAYALMAIAALHIAGAVLSEVRQGSGVVSAMFSGRKMMPGRPIDAVDADLPGSSRG